MSDALTVIAPDALFVVACPVCEGHVAAVGGLCGHDACCPLCASLFHVPHPSAVAAAPRQDDRQATAQGEPRQAEAQPQPAPRPPPAAPHPEPPGMAEDWGGVISQLAPNRKDPEPEPNSTIELADFDLHAAADSPTAAGPEPTAAPTAAGSAADADEPAEVVAITYAGPTSPPRRAAPHQAAPQAAGDDLPVVGGTPLSPTAAELAFSEPVLTIRQGNEVIEIRRLTPEERRARRSRRNLLMIVVGVSILLATYVLLSGR